MIKKMLLGSVLLGSVIGIHLATAAPTTTILLRPQIPSLASNGNPCLTIGNSAGLGLVSTSTCGSGGGSVSTSSVLTANTLTLNTGTSSIGNSIITQNASGTIATVSGTLRQTNATNSLALLDANGGITAYAGASNCSAGMAFTGFSATGIPTCASFNTSSLSGSGSTNVSTIWISANVLGNGMTSQSAAGDVFTIGSTTSPTQSATQSMLQLGTNNITGGNASGTFIGSNPTSGYKGDFLNFEVNSSTVHQLSGNGAVKLNGSNFNINANGNVGIQTTADPTSNDYPLQIQAGSGTYIAINAISTDINHGSGFNMTINGISSGLDHWLFETRPLPTNGAKQNNSFYIIGVNHDGSGHTDPFILEPDGTILLSPPNSLATGNVGVGTSTPDAKMDIDGTVRFEGSSTVSIVVPTGALLGGACDSATTSISTYYTSSTGVFAASPQVDAGPQFYYKAFLDSSGVLEADVCATVAATPATTTINVKLFE